jgi:hypothetical protein
MYGNVREHTHASPTSTEKENSRIMQTAYINDNNRVVLTCPSCKKTREIDATPYMEAAGEAIIAIKFKCSACDCGHQSCKECNNANCSTGNTNVIYLERRKFFRKKVSLPGHIRDHKRRFSVTILNLSRTGLKIKVRSAQTFQPGQKLVVTFTLDDAKASIIEKEIVVRAARPDILKCEFTSAQAFESCDKAIGFYLMK